MRKITILNSILLMVIGLIGIASARGMAITGNSLMAFITVLASCIAFGCGVILILEEA